MHYFEMEEKDKASSTKPPIVIRSRAFTSIIGEIKKASVTSRCPYDNGTLNAASSEGENTALSLNENKRSNITEDKVNLVSKGLPATLKAGRNVIEHCERDPFKNYSGSLPNNHRIERNCSVESGNRRSSNFQFNYKNDSTWTVQKSGGYQRSFSTNDADHRFVRPALKGQPNYHKNFNYEKHVYKNPDYKPFNHGTDLQRKKFFEHTKNVPSYLSVNNKNSQDQCFKVRDDKNRTVLNNKPFKLEKEEIITNDCDKVDIHNNYALDKNENFIVLEKEVCHKREISGSDNLPEYADFKEGQMSITIKTLREPETVSEFEENAKSIFTKSVEENTDMNKSTELLLKSPGNFIPPPTGAVQDFASDLKLLETSDSPKPNVDYDTSSTIESCSSFPEPDFDHLEAITKYILKIVSKRCVDTTIADKVVHDLNTLFKVHLEGNVIDVYGSYRSNLAITTSDINIVMKPIGGQSVRKQFMHSVYKVLCNDLKSYSVCAYEEAEFVTDIKIRFGECKVGSSCTLAYLGKYHNAYLSMARYLKSVCFQDKRVRPLIIATKVWAEICQINEVEDGKLHPIGFTLMMIHFLQQCNNPVLSEFNSIHETVIPSEASVGELWLGFLKYYALTFNWQQNVVTITSKEVKSKKSFGWENYWMAIEDPYTHKNIAKSVNNSDTAEHIKTCFKAYYQYFANPPENSSAGDSTDEEYSNDEKPKYVFSFRHCFVDFDANFCEMCDELDDTCDECQKKICENPMPDVPKMTDDFLKIIKDTLHAVHDKYMLTQSEVDRREEFVKTLEMKVRRLTNYRDVELKLFGSSVNGFGFRNSDLDICVIFKTEIKDQRRVLLDLRHLLRKNPNVEKAIAIFNAKVPILKFQYLPNNWRVDISLGNSLAVHNSRLLRTYSMLDERCRILGCCLKLLAKKAIISDTTDKALSSYTYLIMLIHFLQQTEPPVLPVLQDSNLRVQDYKLDYIIEDCNTWFCEDLDYIKKVHPMKNETPVEQLWLDLLQYYCTLDHQQLISIRQKEPIRMEEKQHSARLFNVEDPFIVNKNLGRTVSDKMAHQIANTFHRAWKIFRTPREAMPCGVEDAEDLFFSTMSLTGKVCKEAHCDSCGKYGHEKKDCNHGKLLFRKRPFRRFPPYNNYKSRNAPWKQNSVNKHNGVIY